MLVLAPVLGELQPGDHTRSIEVGDLTRSYMVHVPPSYDGSKPFPVVLVFHGGGSNAEQMVRFCGLNEKADDGMTVTRKTYGPGSAGSEVILFVIEGGGHTWPGREPRIQFLGKSTRDISANDLMWEFFRKHPRSPSDQ